MLWHCSPWGEYSKKFYMGRLCPRYNPYPSVYHFHRSRKCVPVQKDSPCTCFHNVPILGIYCQKRDSSCHFYVVPALNKWNGTVKVCVCLKHKVLPLKAWNDISLSYTSACVTPIPEGWKQHPFGRSTPWTPLVMTSTRKRKKGHLLYD